MELPAGRLRLSHGVSCALMYSGRAGRRRCLLQLELRVTHNGLHELVPDLEHGCKLPLMELAESCVGLLLQVQMVLVPPCWHLAACTTVLSWHVCLCCAPAASCLTDFSPLSLVTVYHVKV